jgi:hypothetical protein
MATEGSPSIPSCGISVDKEGCWYYQGAEIIRREIIGLFCRHLERDDRGRYLINWNGQRCFLETEDTPLVVRETRRMEEGGEVKGVILRLTDGSEELLAPESLFIGPLNVPYCRVREGKLPARFSRKAYYQLATLVEEDGEEGGFSLRIGGHRFPIRAKPHKP